MSETTSAGSMRSPQPAGGHLAEEVRAEVARGADRPDYFSTRPTAELQTILRDTSSLPIENLINTGVVRIDYEQARIYRDVFWKGSFAKDSLLGWAEALRDKLLGNAAGGLKQTFAGGSFWKRFDRVEGGVATGYVVNYEISELPGLPEVRTVAYPDDKRRYFRKGDTVLLLSYTNDPYRLVYDTIKVIDAQNAIGVMHLGTFPKGVEVATFVLARHNYPFENMSIPDHQALFADAQAQVPSADRLAGSKWEGRLIFHKAPDTSLLNAVNPVLFHVAFRLEGDRIEAQCRAGAITFTCALDRGALEREMRMIGSDTLLGCWPAQSLAAGVSSALADLVHAEPGQLVFYSVLKRSDSGAPDPAA